jgi:hypothetical protein
VARRLRPRSPQPHDSLCSATPHLSSKYYYSAATCMAHMPRVTHTNNTRWSPVAMRTLAIPKLAPGARLARGQPLDGSAHAPAPSIYCLGLVTPEYKTNKNKRMHKFLDSSIPRTKLAHESLRFIHSKYSLNCLIGCYLGKCCKL